MAKFSIQYLYEIKDKYSRQAAKIKRSTDAMKKGFDRAAVSVGKMGKKMRSIGAVMGAAVTLPIILMGKSMIQAAADMETMQVSFDVLLGSAEKGKKLFGELKEFSASTPFQLGGIANSATQLLAAGTSAENMTKELQLIGDLAAGAKVPINEMATIYAKSKNLGKAMAEELNQFALRGIPVLRILAEQYGVTTAEILKMGAKGEITFDVLNKALVSMTGEGGLFFGMMDKQSKTFNGLVSTMKDNVFLLQASLGEELLPTAIKFVKTITKMAQEFKALSPETKRIILLVTGITAALGVVILAVGMLIAAIGAIVGGGAISLVVAGVLGIGAAFAWLSVKSGGALNAIKATALGVVDVITSAFVTMGAILADIFMAPVKLIMRAIDMIPGISIPSGLTDFFATQKSAAGFNSKKSEYLSGALVSGANPAAEGAVANKGADGAQGEVVVKAEEGTTVTSTKGNVNLGSTAAAQGS